MADQPSATSSALPNKTVRLPHLNLTVLGVLVAVFAAVKLALFLLLPAPAVQATDLAIPNISQAINRERSLRNLLTLNTDSRLSSAAQSKADDMQARHYFSHVDPDGNYIWPKIVAAGYTPYVQLGENLAIDFYDTDSLVAAWMNSPTHRENILNEGFKDQGMGLDMGDASIGQYHSVVVNTFGELLVPKAQAAPAPAAAPPPAAPAPAAPAAAAPAKKTAAPAAASQPEPAAPAPAATTGPAASALPKRQPESPLNPRGGYAFGSAQSQTTPTPNASAAPSGSLAGAVNKPPLVSAAANYQINHYFTLGFGIVLLLFLLTDLQQMAEKKLELMGRKFNNIALAVLALIVIAVMYWL